MPRLQVLTPPTPEAEPVTPALAITALRLDLETASADPAVVAQLDYLRLLLSAAREKVEAYTGRYFAAQTLQLTFGLWEPYELPAGAVATAVTGFYTDLAALADRAAYLVEYQKGISVNRDLDWADALQQEYTVTATLAPGPVPALVQAAILELAGEWYRNRETSVAGVAAVSELPVSWRVKLAQLVVQPLGGFD